MAAKIIFWGSTALILYTFAVYPLLLWLLQWFFRRPVRKSNFTPKVSMLVAAYNEEGVIGEKVRNALALDYPPNRLEVVVASDGSTDRTAQIVSTLIQGQADDRVRLLNYPENRGKLSVLNDAILQLKGEIVVFSDASSMLARDALRELIANFADEKVGATSGVYQVLSKDAAELGRQEDLYWKYETYLKIHEAKLGALTGAHGSLYAMRKSLYPFPPLGTINDDFVIPTSRIRITAGNVAQLLEIRPLLWPPRPLVLFCFISHKAARLVVPIAMVAAFICNLFLWKQPLYAWLLAGQAGFYALAIAGALSRLRPRALRLPYYFCMINASLFVWLYYRLARRKNSSSSGGKRPGVVWT